ncbi:MAG: hypothetical protein J1F31_05570 [Erysipelotrichales bacterium]|nr:hypothetical protein [Erysipelotrichales bacterium]
MVPKIIHYCWLSNDPYPPNIQECIQSWYKYLGDYEFKLWNKENFDIDSVKWVKEAYEAKKYAFAADYIRLYALYTDGGIYLDTDVLVYKSFNDLLQLPYFIGQDFIGAFEPAIIGAQPGLSWIKKVIDFYTDRDFINPDGTLNIKNLPVVFFERLFPLYSFKKISSESEFDFNSTIFNLFPYKFFNGRDNVMPKRFPVSYTSHLFANSWSDSCNNKRIKGYLPSKLFNCIYGFNYHFLRKKIVHFYDPIYRQS